MPFYRKTNKKGTSRKPSRQRTIGFGVRRRRISVTSWMS